MYTGCYLKTTELLDYALIGICAVIRSNTVYEIAQDKVLLCSTQVLNIFSFLHKNINYGTH